MSTPMQRAIADFGYAEQPPGSNLTKFGDRFWPGKPSPWCAEAVSCWTKDAAWGGPFNASVGYYRNQARAQGRIIDLPTALAHIERGGCVSVGFEWGHDTWPDHIGLLAGLGNGVASIRTLEGNSPAGDGVDRVAYHQRSTSLVAFYCRLDGPMDGTPLPMPPAPELAPVHPGKPVLRLFLTAKPNGRRGFTNHGDSVAVLQSFFHALGGGWDPGRVDGIIGPRTNDIIGRFQRSCGLTVDYVVGQQTWAKAFG